MLDKNKTNWALQKQAIVQTKLKSEHDDSI
ncbi:hypothetical protein N473_14580 [Pseudoalteromonas luteoviolacea CPMOR-1]|uniref:Uncharacterized protein n=1 Tax=Pseudoalteromonas luteoviolacea CPMOR-1 TaxID=1365248 RepID=A0A161Z7S1_9GAMM|nr:hypothetical protein N473_14580 [Pseudoalteromonas luteoviolacea CPMOR-1]